MDLSSEFVAFAQLGASWVLWLLIALSVLSIGVMIDRALWFRGRALDAEQFTRELRGALARDEVDRFVTKYQNDPAVAAQIALIAQSDPIALATFNRRGDGRAIFRRCRCALASQYCH